MAPVAFALNLSPEKQAGQGEKSNSGSPLSLRRLEPQVIHHHSEPHVQMASIGQA